MNATAVNRLLNAPTSVWTAHLQAYPNWAVDVAQCLQSKTVSPLAVTSNLRKLTDCMASPEIQPLLCDWLATIFNPSETRGQDMFERVQEGIGKCIRTLQMQAIAQGSTRNILPYIEELVHLTGEPFENHAALCAAWTPKNKDVYTAHAVQNKYFVNGVCLGGEQKLKEVASKYKQCIAQTMLDHRAKKDIQTVLYANTTLDFAGHRVPMAHALLWASARLDNATKYALAYDWANPKGWSTKTADENLSPQKTRYWSDWAHHAKVYLDVSGATPTEIHDIKEALKGCPPLLATKKMEDIDAGLFQSPSFVVQ